MALQSAYAGGMDEGRVPWVDTAKGLCIVLVVMMHATLGVGEAMGGEGFMHWVVAFARPFRMPDFFLVSGLFLSRVIDRDWKAYADRRVVHFLYFYLLWLVIQSALKYGQVSGGTPTGFVHHLALSLIEPFGTLWFVYLLAVFSVATKLLRGVPPVILLALAAALQIIPVHTGWTLIDEFCARFVYFLAGYFLAPAIFRLAEAAVARPALSAAGLAVWALANATVEIVGPNLQRIRPLFGIRFAVVTIAALLTPTRLATPFRHCGRHSIAIYLAFFLPMAATRAVLLKSGVIDDVGLVAAIVTAVAVVAPLILERLVRETPFSFLFRRPAAFHIARARAPRLQPAE